MPYWQLFYHLVWSTKNREPLLTLQTEKHIYGFLTSKAVGLRGVVYTVGGTADHVHMVVAIPPAISVAQFVGQVKGVASARFNKSGMSTVRFEWQAEYGAFSFDAKRLPNFIGYVERQKEHHDKGTVIPVLERMTADNEGPRSMMEAPPPYATDEDSSVARWLQGRHEAGHPVPVLQLQRRTPSIRLGCTSRPSPVHGALLGSPVASAVDHAMSTTSSVHLPFLRTRLCPDPY